MRPVTLLGLALLGAGGAYAYKKYREEQEECAEGFHLMSDGTCMADAAMPPAPGAHVPGPAPVSPPGWDAMVGLYLEIIYDHGTPLGCERLLNYIDSLVPENDAEDEWLEDRRAEVLNACKNIPGFFGTPEGPDHGPFTQGRAHVGDCGCEDCKAKARVGHGEEKPCCAECAAGVGACACAKRKPEPENATAGAV